MEYSFLSGGTGTPKLLEGFRNLVDDEQIGVICNGGDDQYWHSLRVCPDLDTVIYLFANKLDLGKYWGITNDTFNTLKTLKSFGMNEWFNIGDEDLGLHIYRSELLKNNTLTEITVDICQKWNIKASITPMSDNLIQSKIISFDGKEYNFQDFFVRLNSNIDVKDVIFQGEKNQASQLAIKLIQNSKHLIIGPSNPVTSIGPILSLKPINIKLKGNRNKLTAISPIIGDKAFSGPTVKLMKAMNIEISPFGLAKYYSKFISKLILDPSDKIYDKKIKDVDIETIYLPIDLKTTEQKNNLAKSLMEIL